MGSSTTKTIRPNLRERKNIPQGKIRIKPPKNPPSEPLSPSMLNFLPMLTMALMILGIAMFSQGGNALFVLPMAVMSGMMMFVQRYQHNQASAAYDEKMSMREQKYLQGIKEHRRTLTKHRAMQHAALEHNYPAFAVHMDRARRHSSDLWQRRLSDEEFLTLRVGSASIPFAYQIDLQDNEDPLYQAAYELKSEFQTVERAAFAIDLRRQISLDLVGRPHSTVQGLSRLIVEATALHSPDDLHIYLFSNRLDAFQQWDWLRWLPHVNALRPKKKDISRLSLSTTTHEKLLEQLRTELRARTKGTRGRARFTLSHRAHLLVIFDEADGIEPMATADEIVALLLSQNSDERDGVLDASVIFAGNVAVGRANSRLDIDGERFGYRTHATAKVPQRKGRGRFEAVSKSELRRFACALAPLVVTSKSLQTNALPSSKRLLKLLDVDSPQDLDLAKYYHEEYKMQRMMRFPIGVGEDGKTLYLILREKGRKGAGTHAMLAGTTGSGKSVTLQSLVISMAIHNSPRFLNIMLADFKGGASELSKIQDLPHIVGFVSDLGSLASIQRVLVSIRTELTRRKQLMDTSDATIGKKVASIWEYNKQAREHPLPHLVILLDEFAQTDEIASRNSAPEFTEQFNSVIQEITAQGRALGVHLIISTQRGTDFSQRGFRKNIEVGLSLMVEDEEDSNAILNVPDAAKLSDPGRGLLRRKDEVVMFQGARVDQVYQPASEIELNETEFTIREILADGLDNEIYKHEVTNEDVAQQTVVQHMGVKTEAELITERIKAYWSDRDQPSLICQPELDEASYYMIPKLVERYAGEQYQAWQANDVWEVLRHDRFLNIAIGELDLPHQQRQDLYSIDLTNGDGHYLAIGSVDAGRTMFLHALLTSLALSHPWNAVDVYIASNDPSMQVFSELAHTVAVVRHSETESMMRLFTKLSDEHTARRSGRESADEEDPPAIILILDDFDSFRAQFPVDSTEDRKFATLLREGSYSNIHIVLTNTSVSPISKQLESIGVERRLALGLDSAGAYMAVLGERAVPARNIEGRGYIRFGREKMVVEAQVGFPAFMSDALPNLSKLHVPIMGPHKESQVRTLATKLSLLTLWQEQRMQKAGQLSPIGLEFDTLDAFSPSLDVFGNAFLLASNRQNEIENWLLTFVLATVHGYGKRDIDKIIVFSQREEARFEKLSRLNNVAVVSEVAEMESCLSLILESLKDDTKQCRYVVTIDDLGKLHARNAKLMGLMEECVNLCTRSRACHFILGDTPQSLKALRSYYDPEKRRQIKLVENAGSSRNGVAFSAKESDPAIAILNLAIDPRQRRFHEPKIGGSRAWFSTGDQPKVIQFATVDDNLDALIEMIQ